MDEFKIVLQGGILRHDFIPSFNLLQVKMTREAQLELLQLYDMAIQYDIRIIEKCLTLKWIWEILSKRKDSSGIYQPCCNNNYCLYDNPSKRQLIDDTKDMIYFVNRDLIHTLLTEQTREMITTIDACTEIVATPLVSLFFRGCLLVYKVSQDTSRSESNKVCYNRIRLFDNLSVDIVTGKLWVAISYLIRADNNKALLTINRLLSSIPPYALYWSRGDVVGDIHTNVLYLDKFVHSELDFSQIGRKAWIFDFCVFEKRHVHRTYSVTNGTCLLSG